MTTLRDEQKRIARDRIMEALAAEIVERGVLDVSVPGVAARARVSARTVYNYYESKDGLLGALGPWAEQYMSERGGVIVETELDRLPDAIRTNFRVFSEIGVVAEALARLAAAADPESPAMSKTRELSAKRTDAVRQAVHRLRPDLEAGHVEAIAGVLRIIASFNTWLRLTARLQVDAGRGGEAAAWLVNLAVEALRDGRGPFDQPERQ